jgi:hypothetical protein
MADIWRGEVQIFLGPVDVLLGINTKDCAAINLTSLCPEKLKRCEYECHTRLPSYC